MTSALSLDVATGSHTLRHPSPFITRRLHGLIMRDSERPLPLSSDEMPLQIATRVARKIKSGRVPRFVKGLAIEQCPNTVGEDMAALVLESAFLSALEARADCVFTSYVQKYSGWRTLSRLMEKNGTAFIASWRERRIRRSAISTFPLPEPEARHTTSPRIPARLSTAPRSPKVSRSTGGARAS
jgi:hypothetical protein